MPRHKNRVNLDPDTKSKSFSIHTLKTSWFRSLYSNQVIWDHPHNQINIIPTLKSSQIPPPHLNQVNFDHPHKNQVKFDARTKTKWFLARIQNPRQFRPPTQKPSPSIPTLKTRHFRPANKKPSQNRSPTQKPSQSIPALKTSHFRPAHKNQVIFDSYIKTK